MIFKLEKIHPHIKINDGFVMDGISVLSFPAEKSHIL